MKRISKDHVALGFLTLFVALIPSAAVAEIAGKKDVARYLLWTGSASFCGCVATIPGITREHSKITHREEQARDYLYCRISTRYPEHNVRRFIKNGAKQLRRAVRGDSLEPINPEHTYLTMMWLFEVGALEVFEDEEQTIYWRLHQGRIPRLITVPPKDRDKCFSCRYWTDSSGEVEVYGKEPDELTCAVNPLHEDTFKGCEQYEIDELKPDLSQCINKVTR